MRIFRGTLARVAIYLMMFAGVKYGVQGWVEKLQGGGAESGSAATDIIEQIKSSIPVARQPEPKITAAGVAWGQSAADYYSDLNR